MLLREGRCEVEQEFRLSRWLEVIEPVLLLRPWLFFKEALLLLRRLRLNSKRWSCCCRPWSPSGCWSRSCSQPLPLRLWPPWPLLRSPTGNWYQGWGSGSILLLCLQPLLLLPLLQENLKKALGCRDRQRLLRGRIKEASLLLIVLYVGQIVGDLLESLCSLSLTPTGVLVRLDSRFTGRRPASDISTRDRILGPRSALDPVSP